MSQAILADTNVPYALATPSDQYYQQARSEHAYTVAHRITIVVPSPVLFETYNLILRRVVLSVAHQWLDEVALVTQFLVVSDNDIREAIALVKQFADQPLSLVDGILAILSERLDIAVWSYDHHLDVLGVRRWVPE